MSSCNGSEDLCTVMLYNHEVEPKMSSEDGCQVAKIIVLVGMNMSDG